MTTKINFKQSILKSNELTVNNSIVIGDNTATGSSQTLGEADGFASWNFNGEVLALTAFMETSAFTILSALSPGDSVTLIPLEGESTTVTISDTFGEPIEGVFSFFVTGIEGTSSGISITLGSPAPSWSELSNNTLTFSNVTQGDSIVIGSNTNFVIGDATPFSGKTLTIRDQSNTQLYTRVGKPDNALVIANQQGIFSYIGRTQLTSGEMVKMVNIVPFYSVNTYAISNSYDLDLSYNLHIMQITQTASMSINSFTTDLEGYTDITIILSGHPTTPQNISWNASNFQPIGVSLPTTIQPTKRIILKGLVDHANDYVLIDTVSVEA